MPSPPRWSGWWPSCRAAARPGSGQREMADAVRLGIAERKHVAVQAGTGTGKTLAYLVPAILSGRRTVVATATKALQDQLAGKDLPFLREAPRPPLRLGGAQGPLQLPVHAAAGRAGGGRRRRGPARPRRRGRAGAGRGAAAADHLGGHHRHRRSGRARRGAVGAGVERGQRQRPGVPRRGPLPERRHLLRGGGPQQGARGRRRGRQPPPLHASTSAWAACCSTSTSWP